MKGNRSIYSHIKLILGLCLCLLPVSCGGGSDSSSYLSSSYQDPYPFTMYYDIYIKVADLDGNPMSGVTVWVDGEPLDEKTSGEYTTLGSEYPTDLQGFKCNFIHHGSTSIDFPGDRDEIVVAVSKTGYKLKSDSFIMREYYDTTTIYYWNTFIMEPDNSNP